MTSALLVTTTPREISPRWVREGDQVAVLAHIDPDQTSLVRSADFAKSQIGGDLIQWWTVRYGPEHLDASVIGSPTFPKHPLSGFRMLIAPDDGMSIEFFMSEREQVVVREQVKVEPWDVICRGLDGSCYLSAGHAGDHDPDPDVDNGFAPEGVESCPRCPSCRANTEQHREAHRVSDVWDAAGVH